MTGILNPVTCALQYEKFFSDGAVNVATVYCPISYPPQPVLVFKTEQGITSHHITSHHPTPFHHPVIFPRCPRPGGHWLTV